MWLFIRTWNESALKYLFNMWVMELESEFKEDEYIPCILLEVHLFYNNKTYIMEMYIFLYLYIYIFLIQLLL